MAVVVALAIAARMAGRVEAVTASARGQASGAHSRAAVMPGLLPRGRRARLRLQPYAPMVALLPAADAFGVHPRPNGEREQSSRIGSWMKLVPSASGRKLLRARRGQAAAGALDLVQPRQQVSDDSKGTQVSLRIVADGLEGPSEMARAAFDLRDLGVDAAVRHPERVTRDLDWKRSPTCAGIRPRSARSGVRSNPRRHGRLAARAAAPRMTSGSRFRAIASTYSTCRNCREAVNQVARRRVRAVAFQAKRLVWFLLAVSCAPPSTPSGSTRIVTTAPSTTEIAFALGLGPSVVGVSDYCRLPPEAAKRTRVGPYLAPSLERILALRPDLVVLDQVQAAIVSGLERAGVRTVGVRMQNLEDVRVAVRAVGRAGAREREAAALLRGLDHALEQGPRLRGQPRALLIVGRDPGTFRNLVACGPSSFAGELLHIAGGRNAFDDVERPYFQISIEGVLARSPDVIVEIVDEGVNPETAKAQWSELAAVVAVRTNRVYVLRNRLLTTPGPRAPEALAALVRTIEPPP